MLEKLINDRHPDSLLLIDVASGRGHDLLEFQDGFLNTGNLILHDQQPVLDGSIPLTAGVEKHKIDFFKDSPVKGKREEKFLRVAMTTVR